MIQKAFQGSRVQETGRKGMVSGIRRADGVGDFLRVHQRQLKFLLNSKKSKRRKLMLKILKTAGLFLLVTVCLPGLVFAQDKKVLAKIGSKIITVSEFNKILSFY